MIDTKTKQMLNEEGVKLGKALRDFYGKITFNFFDGNYVSSNVEQTIKKDNLKIGAENESK